MSELLTMVAEQGREIKELKDMIHQLTLLVMKDKVDTTWLDEKEAADALGYDPRTLREKVKAGEIPVESRNYKGRNWQYSRKGILKFKEQTVYEPKLPIKRTVNKLRAVANG